MIGPTPGMTKTIHGMQHRPIVRVRVRVRVRVSDHGMQHRPVAQVHGRDDRWVRVGDATWGCVMGAG